MKTKCLQRILLTVLFTVPVLLCGCATIISGTTQPVRVTSDPMGAKFAIYNQKGNEVATGNTPQSVVLSRHGGTYRFTFEYTNYYPSEVLVAHGVNMAYFGNILLGGLLGMVIVDPLSGAMWTYPVEVNRNLICTTNTFTPEQLRVAEAHANPAVKPQSASSPKSPKR